MPKLESELLRTFLAIIDTGSISAGAAKIGRSQSAVSLQVKRLESIIGKPVFERHGRGVVPSPAGEALEPVARHTISLLDASLAQIRSDDLAGTLRIGIPDDRSRTILAGIVAEFSKRHPQVELEVHCAAGAGFAEAVADGRLDLALYEVEAAEPRHEVLSDERTFWVASRFHFPDRLDPLPIALFDRACWWRDVALQTLRRSERNYRIVYSSESVGGVAAAIEAGIAIGLLGEAGIGKEFRILNEPDVFNHMPHSKLVLDQGGLSAGPAGKAMCAAIRQAFGHAALSQNY
ncbi:MAG: LysR substrate-binding domain-containing protein [Alphaproteobacteria bacterium]|nr:LysR substrate-binding domain-containing protein [Alphaproteobacteria bacterium]